MMVSACSVVLQTTTCFSLCARCDEYEPPSFCRSIHVKANCSNCNRYEITIMQSANAPACCVNRNETDWGRRLTRRDSSVRGCGINRRAEYSRENAREKSPGGKYLVKKKVVKRSFLRRCSSSIRFSNVRSLTSSSTRD